MFEEEDSPQRRGGRGDQEEEKTRIEDRRWRIEEDVGAAASAVFLHPLSSILHLRFFFSASSAPLR
jgi:hypothetical protein